jgi:hypothetical protein
MPRKSVKRSRRGGGSCGKQVLPGGKRKSSRKSSRKSRKSSKKSVKRVSSSGNKCKDTLSNPQLTALCMKCFIGSNKRVKQSKVSLKGRRCKKTKNGRDMILGFCEKCGGKMAKLL